MAARRRAGRHGQDRSPARFGLRHLAGAALLTLGAVGIVLRGHSLSRKRVRRAGGLGVATLLAGAALAGAATFGNRRPGGGPADEPPVPAA